jgi:hypothetical protein
MHEAALASSKLTRLRNGGQPTHRKPLCLAHKLESSTKRCVSSSGKTAATPDKELEAMSTASCSIEELPHRLFLDSSMLQRLESYGEFIYDGGSIDETDRIWSIPGGVDDIEALRCIMFVGQRACFELVVSNNSFREVEESGRVSYLMWAYEILGYWQDLLRNYSDHGIAPFSGRGAELARKLESSKFGYLSDKDRLLIRDAVMLECHAFLTMDNKLARDTAHIEKELGLKVLSPTGYWKVLQP